MAGEFPSNELPDDACGQGNSYHCYGLQTEIYVEEEDEVSSWQTPELEKEENEIWRNIGYIYMSLLASIISLARNIS